MTENQNKKVALYLRVSTREQDTDMQLEILKQYSERRGFTIVEVYNEVGISGAIEKRPELDRLMADAKKRKFDVVLVFKFDRFARSTTHLLKALEEFRALGIDFISYSENIDTTTPVGKMVFTMVAAIAEFERALIRERVVAGLSRARAKGKKLGRRRTPIVGERLLSLYQAGRSIREIARELKTARSTVHARLKEIINSVPNPSKNSFQDGGNSFNHACPGKGDEKPV